MRKTLTTAALVFVLSCYASAGEMATPGSPTPPPATTGAMQEPTVGETFNGEIHTPGVSDTLTQFALELLTALPSLL